ncbi:hypothetical protein EDD21DRAFT_375842 [Dissophora ornata]|nr:hypothetical protein EDD21DRAFT_375842 [Dissophora ornata]
METTTYSHFGSRGSHPEQRQMSRFQHSRQQQQEQPSAHTSYYFSNHSHRMQQATPASSFVPSLPSASSPSVDRSRPLPEGLQDCSPSLQAPHRHAASFQKRSPPSPFHLTSPSAVYHKNDYASSNDLLGLNSKRHRLSAPDLQERILSQHDLHLHHSSQQQHQQEYMANERHAHTTDAESYFRQEASTPRRTSTASSMSSSPSFSSSSPASSVSVPSSSSPSPRSSHKSPLSMPASSFPTSQAVSKSADDDDTIDLDEKALISSLAESRSSSRPRSESMDLNTLRARSLSSSFSAMNTDAMFEESEGQALGILCPVLDCGKVCSTQEDLEEHSYEHCDSDANGQFPCTVPDCTATLQTQQSQTAHIRLCKQKASGELFQCTEPGCDVSYTSSENLSRHRLKHARRLVGAKHPCTWPGCKQLLATPKSLKDHLQIHEERSAKIRLTCPNTGCRKVFGTNRCLRAHELRCKQVKSGLTLTCPIKGCMVTFKSKDYVRRHVLDHEKGLIGKRFECDYADCTAVLANPLTLQRHKQLHEEQSLGFEWICLVQGCGKAYSGSKQLKDHHTRLHKDLDPGYRFLCPYKTCEEKFDCQRTAYIHQCLYNQKQCPIEGCPCLLPNDDALALHVFIHDNLTTRPPYPCFEENCPKVFDNIRAILAHAHTHVSKDKINIPSQ